jgi:hypothetical protein
MTTQAKNSKLDTLLASAKKTTTAVKDSTAKVDSVKEDYRKIPIAQFYEVNSKGIVRTIDKKVPVVMKKGTGKFYLRVDASGTRKLFSPEQIKASMPVTARELKDSKRPAKVDRPEKNTAPVDIKNLDTAAKEKVEKIISDDGSNYVKVSKLNKLKYSNKDISGFLGITPSNVARCLRHIAIGRVTV